MKKKLPRLVIVALLLLSSIVVTSPAASDSAQSLPREDVGSQLIGTWTFVENIEHNQVAPGKGRLMFYTGKHWLITQADLRTHEVVFHHGGTYTLRGDEL